jgi:hypothetical protein
VSPSAQPEPPRPQAARQEQLVGLAALALLERIALQLEEEVAITQLECRVQEVLVPAETLILKVHREL